MKAKVAGEGTKAKPWKLKTLAELEHNPKNNRMRAI